MGSKLQSSVACIFSALSAAALFLAGVYELGHDEMGMAVMLFMAMFCAMAICWLTRQPYKPRIVFAPKERKRRRARPR